MPRLSYLLADVFTRTPLGGNALAMFPDGGGLPASTMRRVAAELNLSETVFVQPPDDPGNTCRLRIFTPAMELPFAGHPTIGAACLLAVGGYLGTKERALRIEEGIGVVPVDVEVEDARTAHAVFRVEAEPAFREAPPAAELAGCVSLRMEDLANEGHGPEAVSCGVPFQVIPVRDAATLARAHLEPTAWSRVLAGHWAPHVYLVARLAGGERPRFRARMFAPAMGIAEDPATGAAAAALGAWLRRHQPPAAGVLWCDIEQGIEIGRHSIIELGVPAPSHTEPPGIRIGGDTVLIGEGCLDPGPAAATPGTPPPHA